MRANRRLSALSATCCFGALWLAGCTKETPPPAAVLDEPANELKWAHAALERNPDLKVVSIDKDHNTIKVQIKSSGETVTVTPGELAAIPIGDLVALTNSANAAREAAAKVVEEPIPTAPPSATEPSPERSASDFKVEHQDGRVRISGPGMNVEAADANTHAQELATHQRYDEPIICEGPRMLHLDRRHINVNGDAIIARGGCELHLTNSEIAATGTAIVIEDATVHIGNSTVQGGAAAYDAGPTAKLFMLNTRFGGIARRDTQAKISDQGGNVWR